MRSLAASALVAGCLTYGAQPAAAECADSICQNAYSRTSSAPSNVANAWCDLKSFANEIITGGETTFTGVAYGYGYDHANVSTISIRCYVQVDGAEVASTPTGTGAAANATAGQVTYIASETQHVELCTEWTGGWTYQTTCSPTELVQIPPQVIWDLYDSTWLRACQVVNLAGDPGDMCLPKDT